MMFEVLVQIDELVEDHAWCYRVHANAGVLWTPLH